MNQLDCIATEWIAARETISTALRRFGLNDCGRKAEAILARLAAHDPPILLEMERPGDDELETAAVEFGHWDEVLAGPETLWPDDLMDLHADAYVRLRTLCREAADLEPGGHVTDGDLRQAGVTK